MRICRNRIGKGQLPLTLLFTLIMIIMLMAGQCKDGKCNEFARISDQSGLDGCGLLLELSDGTILLPKNLTNYDLHLVEGDTVSISYKIIPDAMSVCMRETAAVTLTCIEKISR